jgi:hypothetical protein
VGDHRRKKKDPTLEADLTLLIEPHTGGDPEGKRRLTRKSLRALAQMLPLKESESGSNAVAPTIADSPAFDSAEPVPNTAAAASADSAPRDPSAPSSNMVAPAIPDSTPCDAAASDPNTAAAASADSAPRDPIAPGSDTTAFAPLQPASNTAATTNVDSASRDPGEPVPESPEGVAPPPPCQRRASPNTIGRLLKKLKYSLRSNIKRLIGHPHPDRDRQYRYIQAVRGRFHRRGQPTASIDAKKSELIGNFKNPGRTYCRQPESVHTYDFRSDAEYRATAYGIYDTAAQHAFVVVGISVITGKFAVAAIRRWWREIGSRRYPAAKILMLEADGGGCNGHRLRLWKFELQRFADETGLSIMVCHYPPGASKWNPIEHRVFSRITANWAGEVLRTLEKMLALIRGAGTNTGLVIDAELDESAYEKGIEISDQEMKALNIHHRKICPQWNYIIRPRNPGISS